MRSIIVKAAWVKSGLAASVLLLASGISAAQTVNLTAGPTSVTTPGGSVIPMWGYSCGAAVALSTSTCRALNPNAPAAVAATATTPATPAGWSPVVITVPYVAGATAGTSATSLTINLTNNLVFGTTASIPTSLTIVGQLGGGLGSTSASCLGSDGVTSHGAACVPSPTHNPASVTWSTLGTAPAFTPPPQDARVRSFATEVAAVAPGTGTATALTWSGLRPGTYLIESGTHPSIQGPMGLYGMLVVTTAPASATVAGTAYPAGTTTNTAAAITYNADVPLLLSEIDPVQNAAVAKAVTTTGFNETTVWSGLPGGCGNPATTSSGNCYPPAVNYTPLYYMVNGVAFDKSHAGATPFPSLFPTAPATGLTAGTGTILVRVVNAGLRMHVPSIVGAQTSGVNGVGAAATVAGFTLIAEDGNPVPGAQGSGKPRVQSDVFMAAGKTYDLEINVPAAGPALALYDRELSLSGNAINRDAGMLAYIGANSAAMPATTATAPAVARADSYPSLVAGQTLTVSDPSKGVMANDTNVYGVTLLAAPTNGTLTLNTNGTFNYVPTGTATADSFTYCANGTVTGTTCSSGISATVTLAVSNIVDTAGVTCTIPAAPAFTSSISTYIAVKTPGVLGFCKDGAGLPLSVSSSSLSGAAGSVDANGGFTATHAAGGGTGSFTFVAKNSHGLLSSTYTIPLSFRAPSNLAVTVLDGATKDTTNPITDYRWIIEEDRTFYVDPTKTTKQPCTGTPGSSTCPIVPTLGVNFHTSHMNVVAEGCTGLLSCESGQMVYDPVTKLPQPAVCDVGNGACRLAATGKAQVLPSQVYLDPTKRYYISVLPGDAANPFYNASPTGHGMGGAPIGINPYCTPSATVNCQATAVTVLTQPTPLPPAKLSVFVFEDDFPLNGEHDASGAAVNLAGNDTLAPNEPGLGGFQIHLWDAFGGNGDFTGQVTTDIYNQPLTNSLDGTVDPLSGFNACPITAIGLAHPGTNATLPLPPGGTALDPSVTAGITGQIVTCPIYESDGATLSPLAGQAVVANLFPGRWGVIVTPGADHIARGEEWLQTNTLDGQKAHDAFTRIGEPSYFQEYGPASFHVSVGFANPAIINARLPGVCIGDINLPGTKNCGNTLTGRVVSEHLSRTPDERLYPSGSHDAFSWTQCFVSVGDPDGEDFAFAKCDADGKFSLTGLPDGDWRITTFDQWNDQLVDGLSTPVRLGTAGCPGAGSSANVCNMGDIAATQWQTNLYTRTFIDDAKSGLSASTDTGIPFLNVAVRLRDGSIENNGLTDFTGTVNFNETFPLFSWYTVESDVTRYKNTGIHVVYDAGGPTDGSTACGVTGYPPCGTSTIGHFLANTAEQVSLPTNLRVPGAIYCAGADCTGKSMVGAGAASTSDPPSVCTTTPANTTTHAPAITTCSTQLSTGRIDPPWVGNEGWQGFPGQQNFLEFGKEPYIAGENGGIKGHVVYASTRPFDDPQFLVQTQWEPLVPNVTINLYKEDFASDGVTPTLTLVDHTTTTSFDDFAQGFRADGVTPNMNCPGQSAATGVNPDLFFYSIQNQPDYLNLYNAQHATPGVLNTTATGTPLPANSQYKCYDGMHNWNQIQPAPYDGQYKFPSVTATNSAGKPTTSNCSICSPDPVAAPDLYAGIPMLPAGKYVVEVVVPPGMSWSWKRTRTS